MTDETPRGSTFEIMVALSAVVTTLVVLASVYEPYVQRNLEGWIRRAGETMGLL